MEQVIVKYLTELNIPISSTYCKRLITAHPDYPSLLSIADTLERLGINHHMVRVPAGRLRDVPLPYLVKPAEGRQNLTPIEDEKELIQYLENTEQEHSVILQVQPTVIITDEEHNRQRLEERFLKGMAVAGLVAVAGLLALAGMQTVTWIHAVLLGTALAGTALGYILYAKELKITYAPIEQFCHAGRKTNCDVILNSDAARLFGTVTLSDLVASYFLFQTLVLGLFAPLSGDVGAYYGVLSAFAALSIPVIVFSLYYQAMQAETWCRLCLLVDGVLAVQAGSLFSYIFTIDAITFSGDAWLPAILSFFVFIAGGCGLVLLKNSIKAANQFEQAAMAAYRIKNAAEVFTHLLRREKRVDATPFEQELLIGNPDVPVKILMAASFGCKPCKEGYFRALELVSAFPKKIRLSIRFRFFRANYHDPRPPLGDKSIYLLWYWIHYIYGKKNEPTQTKSLLKDWYKVMEIEEFIEKYPRCVNYDEDDKIRDLAAQHTIWFEKSGINQTPTFFINGYRLPGAYQIYDLMGIVPGLVEHVEQWEMKQKTFATDEELAPSRISSGRSNKG